MLISLLNEIKHELEEKNFKVSIISNTILVNPYSGPGPIAFISIVDRKLNIRYPEMSLDLADPDFNIEKVIDIIVERYKQAGWLAL